jgi:hypothetical protein
MAKHFPSILSIIEKLDGAIPSLHVHNHLSVCQYKWAFKYLLHSGNMCGEIVETGWAEQNQTAGSTKRMNDGHRHDTIDDFCGYWNWSKLVHISK